VDKTSCRIKRDNGDKEWVIEKKTSQYQTSDKNWSRAGNGLKRRHFVVTGGSTEKKYFPAGKVATLLSRGRKGRKNVSEVTNWEKSGGKRFFENNPPPPPTHTPAWGKKEL